MSKHSRLELRLLRQKPIYFPGEWIEGVVLVRLDHDTKIRAIRVKFFGREHTFWVEHYGNTTTVISETHKFVDSHLTLWGYPKGTTSSTPEIASGSYVFPFSVQIPAVDTLPASWGIVSSKCSHVAYGLKAYMDIPRAADEERTCLVTVIPRVTLDANPQLVTPIELEKVGIVGCACCPYGNIQARVRCLQPTLYSEGQTFCTAEITNNSSKNVIGVHVQVFTTAVCRALGRHRHYRSKIVSAHYPVCLAPGETFSNFSCAAPPPLTRITYSELTHGDAQAFFSSLPFFVDLPKLADALVPDFEGHLIQVHHELVFKVMSDDACSFDVRINFEPHVITQTLSDVGSNMPSILNLQGGLRTAVLLEPASTGTYHACFSFDGLDYRPDDQFISDKLVAYPYFYDREPGVISASCKVYSEGLYQELLSEPPAPSKLPASAGLANPAFSVPTIASPPMPEFQVPFPNITLNIVVNQPRSNRKPEAAYVADTAPPPPAERDAPPTYDEAFNDSS